MIKDRGIIKWQAMMLPEHAQSIKKLKEEEKKIQKPILDEQAIEEIEVNILQAMEFNQSLIFQVYIKGHLKYISGMVHYIDHINKQFRIKDEEDGVHFINFGDVIQVQNR
ncbi:YolD-like family protein [Metabacillus fastidiosus]|uniref:YolD-like family protein n=1 Tax=Metabacillus fastidiosus TaxID=1458 RepID=UPI003D2A9C4E